MSALLPPWPSLSAFLAASLVLAVTPGPGVLYIVSRSLLHGRRHGLASVAGVALGNLGNAIGAALGLAIVFAASPSAFALVKYAGALYLIFLGLRALRAAPGEPDTAPAPAALGRAFRDGFLVALLNPKTALFFAAFLPQFMAAGAPAALQGIALGAVFVAVAAVTDTGYAVAAGTVAPALLGRPRVRRIGGCLTGGLFIGLGLFAAIPGTPWAP